MSNLRKDDGLEERIRDLRLGLGLKTGEAVEICTEDIALEREVGEFTLTLDADQARVFKLFHVMGEGGGADGLRFGDTSTGRGAVATTDLGKDLVAAGCGEGLGDEGELAVGEGRFLCRVNTLFCHDVL